MDTANESNGKRSSRRKGSYLGLAIALVVVVGAAWVAIDRSGGQGKSQRSGALVIGNAEYPNVVTVAGDNVAGDDYGSGATQLRGPSKVVLDAAGNLYVADTQNYRVQKFVSGCVNTETSKCAGVTVAGDDYGLGATQLNEPYGVAVDSAGNVFVADTFNHRVQKFVSGCVNTETSKCAGVTVAGGNLAGSAANQLNRPEGVALDAEGNVYVADTFNYRVQRWAPGATAGVTVASDDGYGSFGNWPFDPQGLAVDSNLNLYVVDGVNNRVHKWSP